MKVVFIADFIEGNVCTFLNLSQWDPRGKVPSLLWPLIFSFSTMSSEVRGMLLGSVALNTDREMTQHSTAKTAHRVWCHGHIMFILLHSSLCSMSPLRTLALVPELPYLPASKSAQAILYYWLFVRITVSNNTDEDIFLRRVKGKGKS